MRKLVATFPDKERCLCHGGSQGVWNPGTAKRHGLSSGPLQKGSGSGCLHSGECTVGLPLWNFGWLRSNCSANSAPPVHDRELGTPNREQPATQVVAFLDQTLRQDALGQVPAKLHDVLVHTWTSTFRELSLCHCEASAVPSGTSMPSGLAGCCSGNQRATVCPGMCTGRHVEWFLDPAAWLQNATWKSLRRHGA